MSDLTTILNTLVIQNYAVIGLLLLITIFTFFRLIQEVVAK